MGGEIVRALDKEDQISQMAHLIGGVVGAAFGFLAAKGPAAKALPTSAAAQAPPTSAAIKPLGASRPKPR